MIEVLLEAERAMSFGLLDQAERLYRQAAESDPRNSIAVVGLARVAIERGNDTAAYGLGMAALEIDPDNQAARRLVDRLVEVMTERGDPVPDVPIERGAGAAKAPATSSQPPPPSPPPARLAPPPAQPAPPARPASMPGRTPITRRRLKRTGLLGRLFGRRP